MKNIFNEADRNEILQRIEKLTPESKAVWGKMNVAQMLAHCAKGAMMPTGEVTPKPVGFPINILGRLLKKKILNAPEFRKNSPTAPELVMADPHDFAKEKANFIAAVKKLGEGEKAIKQGVKHPFLGNMTPIEWGRINYLHADHHLRQFGA